MDVERPRIKLCLLCANVCLFTLVKVPGSLQECKCDMCKRLHECSEYEVKTRGGNLCLG